MAAIYLHFRVKEITFIVKIALSAIIIMLIVEVSPILKAFSMYARILLPQKKKQSIFKNVK